MKLACLLLLLPCASAQEPAPLVGPNLALPTWGGRQLWNDVAWRAGWRVQEHAWTGHFRLLDPCNVRRAWGNEAACRVALDERAAAGEREDADPDAVRVVLLHGLGRSRAIWSSLERDLRAARLTPVGLQYASTQGDVEEHAGRLVELISAWPTGTPLVFVTHSLGGLVARAVIDRLDDREVLGLVQLAPPNQGAALAGQLHAAGLAFLLGPAGVDLQPGAPKALPRPLCPTLVIAGGRCDDHGWNRWIPGDDDGVVAVEETRLEGAEWEAVRGFHTCLPQAPRVRGRVLEEVRSWVLLETVETESVE